VTILPSKFKSPFTYIHSTAHAGFALDHTSNIGRQALIAADSE